jgi:hypothetical protein
MIDSRLAHLSLRRRLKVVWDYQRIISDITAVYREFVDELGTDATETLRAALREAEGTVNAVQAGPIRPASTKKGTTSPDYDVITTTFLPRRPDTD